MDSRGRERAATKSPWIGSIRSAVGVVVVVVLLLVLDWWQIKL